MISRALLRQRQAAKAVCSIRSMSTALPARRPSYLQPFSQNIKPFPPRLCQRYSSEAEGAKSEKETAPPAGENGKENGEAKEAEDAVQKELEAKKKEVIDLKDKYLRSVAEFANLQERTRREVESARNFAIQKFAVDLLDSIDNLDRALGAVPNEKLTAEAAQNKDLVDLVTGLRMTERVLLNAMKKHGLERFDPSELLEGKAQKFDPKLHEATFMVPAPGKEDGDVMHTQSKGFSLNGRVLRAAKVGVVKNA
ncbi:Mitochondrial matrix cochaperone [Onygenales sp. PD_12]|nr:Mitochondrial matrix cochaperone [Onygenales sp. PD_12]KAK2790314.1 Mitochondrial matrix cochaperone [Emmonsiellopsis sp. PD_33]KAK2806576.1 Mitochondrial matrix cochaperone [Onygenales sp. PD_10]